MRRLFFFATILFTGMALAQEAPPPGGGGRPGPMGPPKNLKILKPDEVMPTMRAFTVGLGMRCTGCHVQGDFASDQNGHKVVARQMLTMVRQVNQTYFNGNERVTCYTCHRGDEHPKTGPDAGAPGERPAGGPGGPPPAAR
ncbi:MAG TPA: c-type cytochrome [Bryobacteraceae bacterium]|jgi:hypothetical protein|nr:c-type cytochrome [Bryobacteraceae bacterium]